VRARPAIAADYPAIPVAVSATARAQARPVDGDQCALPAWSARLAARATAACKAARLAAILGARGTARSGVAGAPEPAGPL